MAKKEEKTVKDNKKSFIKGFKAELKKVVWPTPKQLVNNTTAVITIVLITAIIVFGLDLVFETVNKHGIDKIKELITTSNSVDEETVEDNTENSDDTTNSEENVDATVEGQQEDSQGQEETNTSETENNTESTENTESSAQ